MPFLLLSEGFTLVAILYLLLSLAGCSGQDDPAKPGTSPDGNCTAQFIADHNAIVDSLRSVSSDDELHQTDSLISQFQTKYAGLHCKAVDLSPAASKDDALWVDADGRVASWRSAVDKLRSEVAGDRAAVPGDVGNRLPYPGNPSAYEPDSRNCSALFVNRLKDVLALARSDVRTRRYLEAKTVLRGFAGRYRDVECNLSKSGEPYLYRVNAEIADLLSEIEKSEQSRP
jgi:hypothetical protein